MNLTFFVVSRLDLRLPQVREAAEVHSVGERRGQNQISLRARSVLANITSTYLIFLSWGQFHQHAYAKLLQAQIPKVKKGSQVISRKK